MGEWVWVSGCSYIFVLRMLCVCGNVRFFFPSPWEVSSFVVVIFSSRHFVVVVVVFEAALFVWGARDGGVLFHFDSYRGPEQTMWFSDSDSSISAPANRPIKMNRLKTS